MPFFFSSHGTLAFLRWGTPTMDDLDPVLAHLRRVRGDVGHAIVISFVPADAAAPAPDVAREMARRFPELMAECARFHQVFEGTGFFVGFKRSVLTGMLLATNKLSESKERIVVSVHSSVAEVAVTLSAEQRADLARLLSEVRAA